jgi:hypothetical protein
LVKVKHSYKTLLALLVFSAIFSCKKILERPSWNTNVTAPLIKTSLGIGDIIKDTAFIKNPDNSISIVENKRLYSFGIDSLVKLEVDPYIKTLKLNSLKLDSQVVTRRITLGEIARQLTASSNSSNRLIGYVILGNQGQTVSVPAFSNITAGPFPIDISQYFQTADLLTGTMTVKVTNGLPLTIQNLSYDIRNGSSNSLVTSNTFTNLQPQTSQTDTTNLAGKTVEGNLKVAITDMDVNSGTVLIDTNNALVVRISITNITVSAATAVFPAQEVINDHNNVPLIGMKDVQLKEAKIRKGSIDVKATSTIDEPVYFTYTIPGVTIGSDSFVISSRVPPNTDTSMTVDISGYHIDLSGKKFQDTVNSIYNSIIGNLRYTGKIESLSLNDSIRIEVTFSNIEPSYVRGYLGQDTINIGTPGNPSSVSFSLFDKIESGTLNFESVKFSLVVHNGIGVNGEVNINQITAQRKSGTPLDLQNVLPIANHLIPAATDNPLKAAIDTINLSPPASNAVALLNLLPDKISYQGQAILNPSGFSGYNDFAYSGSPIEPYLQLELPLSMIANDLVLADTVDFNGADHESAIKDGNFTIHIENGFPLKGDLKLYFLDAGGLVLDTLVSTGSILPAPITGAKATGKAYSKVPFHVSEAQLNNILRSKKMIFKVKFSTQPAVPGTFVKIYSEYEIDFKLVGEFDYHVH